MRPLVTAIARLSVVVLGAALLVAGPHPASARGVPETLADRQPVGRGPVEPGFPIQYLGVLWDGAEDATEVAPSHGAVRFRTEGIWGRWMPLVEDGAERDGEWASGLVPAGGAEAYQVRGLPEYARRPRAVAINTTDGPVARVSTPAGTAHALDNARCRSRAEWGADESLRFDGSGAEQWPPAFHDAQVTTVHHTATRNDEPDPAATVRAIYRYHAVDRGWGDIGYQYLVDANGVVYEGRWSGTASPTCSAGGDGSAFAHEAGSDRVVTGAHTAGWNSGNVGVALLGDFTDAGAGAEPSTFAVESLEDVLAELARRHSKDPLATVTYTNPVSGEKKTVPTIGGHRDYVATECPGGRLYAMLPAIRQNVAAKMSPPPDAPPAVAVTSPADASRVAGAVTVTAGATDDNGVKQVELAVDGTPLTVDTQPSDGWSTTWDTTTVTEGSHTVEAVATDTAGQTARHSVTVIVDNVADPTVHVRDLDATARSLKKGWRATVTVTVRNGGAALVAGASVRGTWPDGSSASCTTGSTGTCSVTSGTLARSLTSTTFRVGSVTLEDHTYTGAANSDPDGDSDGTSITVRQP